MTVLRYIVPPEADCQRLGIFLRTQGVTAALIKSVKYNGDGFFADGAPLHTDQPVHPGQMTYVANDHQRVTPQPVPFPCAEDEFAAVLEKPAGIAVHATLNYPDGTLANGWLYHLQQQGKTGVFRPVNRIDKNTSGLVLCAQNSFAAPLLADSAQKCYLAIVQGILPLGPGQVEAPIARRGDSIIGRCVPGGRQIQPDPVQRTGCRHRPQPGGLHALHRPHPPDSRTHGLHRPSAGRGHSVWRIGQHPVPACAALRCFAVYAPGQQTGQIRIQSELPPDMAALAHSEGLFNNWDLQEL